MGYTTEFSGSFAIEPPLSAEHQAALVALAETERKEMPPGAPDAYLQWEPTDDGSALRWDGNEKFYDYVEWLRWLIVEWFRPRGYALSGEVKYQGEEIGDCGRLVIANDVVTKIPATFDNSPLDALSEIVRRGKSGLVDVEDLVMLAEAALEKARQ